jgi:mono/diheme cytochrome c family protein
MIRARLMPIVAAVFFLSTVWCSAAEKEGQTLFESNCGKCHSLDKATSKKKTPDAWATTVLRMMKNGATITDDEAKLIMDYLSETYK